MLAKTKSYTLMDGNVVTGEGNKRYVLKVRDLPEPDKPRERMLAEGPASLSHAELIAILLGVGTRKEEVLSMAHRVLREYGERAVVNEKSPTRLAETLDIPLSKACQIVAGFELGRRAYQSREGKPIYIRTPEQAAEHFKVMGNLQKEQLRGLYLNSRFQVIHDEIISVGSLTANIVHPREVFQPAVEYGAVAIVIAHNHPSGVAEPTEDDYLVTDQLVKAGEALGIELLDHLVISGTVFVSCKEKK